MNILDEIAGRTRERIQEEKRKQSLLDLKYRIREQERQAPSFYGALAAPGMSYICELKKASPSKGLIAPDFPYVEIAREYEAAGASAISCLTEPYYFQGTDRYLQEVVQNVSIPILRKDFTVDEYMIYQAKELGASAVLLICAILEEAQVREYRQIAEELGLDALVEAHDEKEVASAVAAGAQIIGGNNRNLRDFSVNLDNAARLRDRVPPGVLYVAESGVRRPADVAAVRAMGADGVLIGEALMRAKDKSAMLNQFRRSV